MNPQTLAEKIIERNFRLRICSDARMQEAAGVEGDLFDHFKLSVAWPNQVQHLTKELSILPTEDLAVLEKEYA